MNHFLSSLFFSILLFANFSCNSEHKHREETPLVVPEFTPKFNEVSKKYILNKRKFIYPFYNQILGNERFNGMFLVAKNGKIIFEKVNG